MSKGLKRTAATLVALVALYALLGFLILPGIALRVANQQLADYSTVPAQLQRLEFNPFSLELTLWGLKIGEPGAEQVGFDRLYANLQLDSLWTGALHLVAVELEKPRTEVLFDKGGKLNLSTLFKLPASDPAAQDAPSEPFALRIGSIKLVDGYLHFKDLRPSQPIEFLYDSMNLELQNLSTLPDDHADMTLVANSPQGGRIDWRGRIGLSPVSSQGSLKVTDAQMSVWWPYVRDSVPLVLEKGMFTLSADYNLNLAKQTELTLNKVALTVAPFAIAAPDGRPLARLERLEISDTSVDLVKQLVRVGQIRSRGLETWAAREANGQLDWQKLFASPTTAQVQAQTPAPSKPAAAPAKPWQVLLKDVQLRDYRVHLADRVPTDNVAVELGPLNLDLRDFDSLNGAPFTLKLDTGLGKQGHLQASGEVSLAPVAARLKVSTQDIDLRVAQAYISPLIRLELRSGMLDSEFAVQLTSTEPLAMTVSGRAEIDQLHTLDTLKERDFVKWQHLTLDGLDYRHGDRLEIERVQLQQPYARFMINEDRTTNIDDLLIPQPAQPANSASAGKPAGAEKPLGIRIGAVDIDNGSANFADFSLTPNFATAVQQLNGRIGTIDNRQAKPARIDIQGKVDRYAPVTIAGALNPFDPMASLDITTSFKRVELTTLTPYSGKFAGYRIRKGRLNLDLHYLITKGQLKAENKLLVEQLQLGDKVDSPDAVDLPLRLAIALLKDSQGRIAIELPVSGDLNSPQFSVMPIVWQTLRNLMVRAAQAPFKFIGGLVSGGGSEDLSTVSFLPGSDELSAEAQAALMKLAAALKERPTLRLEIEGTSAQASDGPLIAQQRLEREYQSTYYKMAQRRGDKVPATAAEMQVPEDDKPAMLEAIYRTRLKGQPPVEWQQLESKVRTDRLREAVLKSWASNNALLRQLGQARAGSIKDFLVDKGQLADERVYFIDAALGQAEKDGRIITPLHLDAE
ncbi:DUF748 domain-containing protein [Pseudomonas sp. CFBP 8770]|uniref:DUF748 domain-containing protein n=1 Tax=unclassified Pseudomonas TaxID=196821 RepID=UPI00178563D8|nr:MULTISPECIES: DUF748 domain-containing protein [unclassified Pseudomonas]MBD8476422.1 DUF748 domain-containing protein [Pseudomonas sp. CFBP 8773]MBD8649204.1 DUF748 domain-containing protein [Pseudomonas sp. CFBP 8770]